MTMLTCMVIQIKRILLIVLSPNFALPSARASPKCVCSHFGPAKIVCDDLGPS